MSYTPTSAEKIDHALRELRKHKETLRDIANRCWNPMDRRDLNEAANHLFEAEERMARILDRHGL